jgi:hypothetical protein
MRREIDETIEVATDGGIIGIGSLVSIRLFEESRDPRAARIHRVFAFDTGDDGVYAIRIRTGFAWRTAAPVRVIHDAIHVFGVGFLSHEISLESGDYAASVVRSAASEDAAVITLERVSEPVRWPFGDSFPAPFAVTEYERVLAYR